MSLKTPAKRSTAKKTTQKPIKGPIKKESMDIRQIENGFIIRRDQQGKNGEYMPPKEEFVKTLPKGLFK